MNHPFQGIKAVSVHPKPAIAMNEDFKNEFQLVLSGLQRLDSKIDSLRSEMKNDLKHFATRDDLLLLEGKIDFKFASKDDLKQFATKNDLLETERRDVLRYATKDDLAQTKYDLIKWTFAFWVTLTLMILGLYLGK